MLGACEGVLRTWWDRKAEWLDPAGGLTPRQASDQRVLATASAHIQAARLLLERAAQRADHAPVTPVLVAENQRDVTAAVELCCSATDELFRSSGIRVLDEGDPLQRAWRDITAARSHGTLNFDTAAASYTSALVAARGAEPGRGTAADLAGAPPPSTRWPRPRPAPSPRDRRPPRPGAPGQRGGGRRPGTGRRHGGGTVTRRIALFDVDQTLLAEKSMISFWRFWSASLARSGRRVPAPRTSGADRETLNRAYFTLFAGVRRRRLEEAAAEWYAHYRRGPDAYLTATVAALEEHRASGDEVALVTGCGDILVRPVAGHLGVLHVLATEQLTDGSGVLTGEVRRPMIAAAKAEAVVELARRLDVPLRECRAYGDHSSDLAMLSLVGHPVVVGDDPVLAERGAEPGWRFLSATTGPQPTEAATTTATTEAATATGKQQQQQATATGAQHMASGTALRHVDTADRRQHVGTVTGLVHAT
ncbi:HAD-IB family hydrolase [Streptomyces tsukubensis]|uniref:HAD-IB family hydrolase n=1 Tax=Streptomyces tsukubensis TaxID=83656 RepID=UPI0018723387|nr:HAD-IB family hydrolase [Streptomyces tsukubensis]